MKVGSLGAEHEVLAKKRRWLVEAFSFDVIWEAFPLDGASSEHAL